MEYSTLGFDAAQLLVSYEKKITFEWLTVWERNIIKSMDELVSGASSAQHCRRHPISLLARVRHNIESDYLSSGVYISIFLSSFFGITTDRQLYSIKEDLYINKWNTEIVGLQGDKHRHPSMWWSIAIRKHNPEHTLWDKLLYCQDCVSLLYYFNGIMVGRLICSGNFVKSILKET